MKLDPSGWLPCWRFKWFPYRRSAIVPAFINNNLFPDERLANARNAERANQSLSSFQDLPGFAGMVYCMRDKRVPDDFKIGGSLQDAWARMRQSPWRRELGLIPHEFREVIFVLACLSIPPIHAEITLQKSLRRLARNIDISYGKGTEWFRADLPRIQAAMEDPIEFNGEEIWLRGLAEIANPSCKLANDTLPNELLCLGF